MPTAPLRPCSRPGCSGRATHGQHCETHSSQAHRAEREMRGTSTQRGYDARHRKWRKMVLARDPICCLCNKAASSVADHIRPLSCGGGWSLDNGQGLCAPCHSKKTAQEFGFRGEGRSNLYRVKQGNHAPASVHAMPNYTRGESRG